MTPLRPWRIRFHNRRMEWLVAAYTAVFGLWLWAPPVSLLPPTFDAVIGLMPEGRWAAVFLIVGVTHLAALAVNGMAWWSPWLRAFAAGTNLMAYAMLTGGIYNGAPEAAAVVTYGYVAASLMVVLFLALRDCFLLRRAGRARPPEP